MSSGTGTELDVLRSLEAAATPGPWIDSGANGYGAIASASPEAIAAWLQRYPDDGDRDIAAYGGALVGESIQPHDRAFIAALRNAAPALLELAAAIEPIEDILAAVIALAVVKHDTQNCWPLYGDRLRETLRLVCERETARHEGGGRPG